METTAPSHTTAQVNLQHLAQAQKDLLKVSVLSFLDTIATATSRGSYYNSSKEVQQSAEQVHNQLFSLDRSVYGLALLLPGLTDFAKQTGIKTLLAHQISATPAFLSEVQEKALLTKLVQDLPPQRALNTFLALKENRVNNTRTRKLLLHTLLNSQKLELWSVKYRSKFLGVLEHAWNKHTTGIIRSILKKEEALWDVKERQILKSQVDKFLAPHTQKEVVYQCLGFVLGCRQQFTLPLHQAFTAAKSDLQRGRDLPYEVLEGIRSTYHRQVPNKVVLELTKKLLTKNQKMVFQRKAEQEKVEVAFNPMQYDATRLYIYAYERGVTPEISEALHIKAKETAKALGANFGKAGILIDNSASMMGNDTQKLHPVAVALATRDVLVAASDEAQVLYTQPTGAGGNNVLISCQGSTSLSTKLIELLEQEPVIVFVISDGYENSASVRLNEVMAMLRQIGVQTPVFHINPVMAAEASGVRKLSPDMPTFPVSKPEALGIGLLKSLIEVDVEKGVALLHQKALPFLTN